MKDRYSIDKEVRFPGLTHIDIANLVAANEHEWHNQTLCAVTLIARARRKAS